MRPIAAHIIDELPPDGAERLIVDLMRRRTEDFDYIVVCLIKGGPLVREIEELGVPVHIIGRKGKYDFSIIWRLSRLLKEKNVAIVHTHLFTADVIGRIAARLAGVKAIFSTSHNVNDWKRAHHILIDRVLSLITTKVIGCSSEVGKVLIKRDGISEDKVAVIDNGIDLKRFDVVDISGVRNEFQVPEGALLMGVVGRLHPQKGHEDLIEALRMVLNNGVSNFHCLFIGDGELRPQLTEQVSAAGLNQKITFTGLRGDVPRLLSALDIFLMPSRWEGLPMALLEAMASGKPVAVTAVGGIPGVIRHGANGLMVPAQAPDLFARCVTQLICEPALRNELSRVAQHDAISHYDVGRVVNAYEKMYAQAISKVSLS